MVKLGRKGKVTHWHSSGNSRDTLVFQWSRSGETSGGSPEIFPYSPSKRIQIHPHLYQKNFTIIFSLIFTILHNLLVFASFQLAPAMPTGHHLFNLQVDVSGGAGKKHDLEGQGFHFKTPLFLSHLETVVISLSKDKSLAW